MTKDGGNKMTEDEAIDHLIYDWDISIDGKLTVSRSRKAAFITALRMGMAALIDQKYQKREMLEFLKATLARIVGGEVNCGD